MEGSAAKSWFEKTWSKKAQAIAGIVTLVTVPLLVYEYGPKIYRGLTSEPLTDDTRAEIRAWAREADRDGVRDRDERAVLEELVAERKLRLPEVNAFLAQTEDFVAQSADLVRQGTAFAQRGEFRKASEKFLVAIDRDSDNVQGWINLGAAQLELGDLDEAESSLNRALDLDSKRWTAHYNLGASLAAGGRTELALESLERSLDLAGEAGLSDAQRRSVRKDLEANQWLGSLRSLPEFEQLLQHEALGKKRG